jgi:Family of unknown function (DUF6415)
VLHNTLLASVGTKDPRSRGNGPGVADASGSIDMAHRTARPAAPADLDQMPPDIATMRATAGRLLALDARPIGPEDLDTLRLTLRGQLELMIPIVEAITAGLPAGDIPAACAVAGVGEARMRLQLGVDIPSPVRMSVSMKLARSVIALCDHYENLGGDHR